MISKSLQLIHLASLCIISFHASMFVEADQGEITRLCSATSYQSVCSGCLSADPSSSNATDIGLVEIAMVCATNSMDTLYQDTFRYQGSTTDPNMKDALNYCLDQFEDAKTKVNNVSNQVKNSAFDVAKQMINDQILGEVISCTKSLQTKGLSVPDIMSTDIDTVHRDWTIVMEMLGSVKSLKLST